MSYLQGAGNSLSHLWRNKSYDRASVWKLGNLYQHEPFFASAHCCYCDRNSSVLHAFQITERRNPVCYNDNCGHFPLVHRDTCPIIKLTSIRCGLDFYFDGSNILTTAIPSPPSQSSSAPNRLKHPIEIRFPSPFPLTRLHTHAII